MVSEQISLWEKCRFCYANIIQCVEISEHFCALTIIETTQFLLKHWCKRYSALTVQTVVSLCDLLTALSLGSENKSH